MYCRNWIGYRALEQMMSERRVPVDLSTIYRWFSGKRLKWKASARAVASDTIDESMRLMWGFAANGSPTPHERTSPNVRENRLMEHVFCRYLTHMVSHGTLSVRAAFHDSCLADHQALPGCLNDGRPDLFEAIDLKDALDLGQNTVQ